MRFLLFASLYLITSLSLSAQSTQQFFDAVKVADISTISSLLDRDVELCIKSNTQMLSRQEATKDIEQFLTQHKPLSIEGIHSGSNKRNDSKYKVAKLQTSDGTFRVFVYMEGSNKISEVRFDTF